MKKERELEMASRAGTSPAFPVTRESVLTPDELARALKTSRRQVDAMDLPFFLVGKRVRFIYGQVLDALAERAENAA